VQAQVRSRTVRGSLVPQQKSLGREISYGGILGPPAGLESWSRSRSSKELPFSGIVSIAHEEALPAAAKAAGR